MTPTASAKAFVAGIGVCGPGLRGWAASRSVLAGSADWEAEEIAVPPTVLLAPNERRRAGLPVRLALAVAAEAIEMAGLKPHAVHGVFGSANGEGLLLHQLLWTLAENTAQVSPTEFHNSIHNAVAGYWAMGAHSRQPMTALGAGSGTFAATLLGALAELAVERSPVLMCVYDAPMPEPLAGDLVTRCAFGCALVLLPTPDPRALAHLEARWRAAPPVQGAELPRSAALAALSDANPAARSLRLLQAIATGRADHRAEFGLLDGCLQVRVDPCSTTAQSAP
ncbi:MAG: beta-ketoacyl synthase chain length factor [Acetobacteraceae bacterium]